MDRAGGGQAGRRRRELKAVITEPDPGLPGHLHIAGGEDALACGARDAALVPVLVHLADQADALPLVREREGDGICRALGCQAQEGAYVGQSHCNLTPCMEESGLEWTSW